MKENIRPKTLLQFWETHQDAYLGDVAYSTRSGHLTVLRRLVKYGWDNWASGLSESSFKSYTNYLDRVLRAYRDFTKKSSVDPRTAEEVFAYDMTWERGPKVASGASKWSGKAVSPSGVSGIFWANWRKRKEDMKYLGYRVQMTGKDDNGRKVYQAYFYGVSGPVVYEGENSVRVIRPSDRTDLTETEETQVSDAAPGRTRVRFANGFELVMPEIIGPEHLAFVEQVAELATRSGE